MIRAGTRVGSRVGQRVGSLGTATPSYAEDYYLAIDPPSQGLISEVIEGVGALTGVRDYSIAVKCLRTPTASNSAYHSVLTADGHPSHTAMVSGTSRRHLVGVWASASSYTAQRIAPADPVPGAEDVVVSYVRRGTAEGVQPAVVRLASLGSFFHVVDESHSGAAGYIPRDVAIGLAVPAPSSGISSAAAEMRFLGAVISAAPISDALLLAWSAGPVDMAAELAEAIAVWAPRDYDGEAMVSRVSGGVRLLAVNMTTADKVAI